MIELDELRLSLLDQEEKLTQLKSALRVEESLSKAAELEKLCAAEGFWDDPENSKKVLREAAALKRKAEQYSSLKAQYEDALTIIELANEEDDASLLDECREAAADFQTQLDQVTLAALLSGEYDANNAILTLHAGAGGTEAMDWNAMLARMYQQWAQKNKYKCEMTDFLDGEEAGLKSCQLRIEGENAYGYLRSEHGVHRLVRCSPFDSSGRRHTSFASVEVMPEIAEDTDIELNPDDIQMDVYRASGAGGQKVNKTSSAVRLTHLPTGVVVSCQVERSQHQNREVCLRMLKSKLLQMKLEQQAASIADIKGEQMKIDFGSQIRSYVFMPYQMVKDLRTNYETAQIQQVMDGELNGFIQAYLQMMVSSDA
ncbi:MAG: peptide chain release factor 2 [Oscillospiraceae bacterium]|jgi:peptide chain release factor 2|nr:peptide chain release factor 2 [Oscillospiraceae bacterium]